MKANPVTTENQKTLSHPFDPVVCRVTRVNKKIRNVMYVILVYIASGVLKRWYTPISASMRSIIEPLKCESAHDRPTRRGCKSSALRGSRQSRKHRRRAVRDRRGDSGLSYLQDVATFDMKDTHHGQETLDTK
jgi:hypothetical protein